MKSETYDLSQKRIAVLATDGFEPSELTEPVKALQGAGAEVVIVSLESGSIKGKGGDPTVDVDVVVEDVNDGEFHGLLLPGGVKNPDTLRMSESAVRFVRSFFEAGKPVAAICHGPWLLVEADVANGRRVTSYASIKTDLVNAGAEWVDEPVVVDQGLVTSRTPDDLDAFNAKMLEEFAEGVHAGQHP